MSGIGIIVSRDGGHSKSGSLSILEKALGPYGAGYSAKLSLGNTGLAYTHFANTPESRFERQPLLSEDGSTAVLFDGRLDNREELGLRLGVPDGEHGQWPDSAFILRSWQRFGPEAVRQWYGPFAVIIWHKTTEELWAWRDPMGARTLCYASGGDGFVLASAPRAVLAAARLGKAPDPQRLADTMADFYHDPERSPFAGISRLPAGHVLHLTQLHPTISRYWQPPDPSRTIRYGSDGDYVEAGREVLAEAVKPLLRSLGKIGLTLSGGLDSSAVAVTALRALPDDGAPLHGFTLAPRAGWSGPVPKGRYANEEPLVRDIAALYPRLALHVLRPQGGDFIDILDDAFDLLGTIPRYPAILAKFDPLYRAANAEGVTTMLNGVMGNPTLSWHGHGAYHDWFRSGRLKTFFRELSLNSKSGVDFMRRVLRHGPLPFLPQRAWDALLDLSGTFGKPPLWRRHSLLAGDFADDMQVEARARQFGFSFFRPRNVTSFDQRMTILFGDMATEMGYFDQYTRARYGIEERDPFSDLKLIDWCLRIPEEQYLRNGTTRWLIRRMMKGLLPASVVDNTESGMLYPDWYEHVSDQLPRMRKELESIEDDPDVARVIDIPRLKALLDDWPEASVRDGTDPRIDVLERALVHALAVARFIRWTKGANR